MPREVSVTIHRDPSRPEEFEREACWKTANGAYQTIIGDQVVTVRIEEDVVSIETLRKRLESKYGN